MIFTMKSRIALIKFVYFLWLNVGEAIFLPNMYPRLKMETKHFQDAGKPLFLTPLLAQNITEAQRLARVPLTEVMGIRSYAGFFTVDAEHNSNLYFWCFPSFSGKRDAPVVVWLQGGPGGSSLFGLFTEIGPLEATEEGLSIRKHHWALTNHVIFIDNPAGTGFSFTDSKGYCENEDCVARGLYEFLQQFFTLFPHLKNNDLYIAGESYAGKYIPALGMEIHKRNTRIKEEDIHKPNTRIKEEEIHKRNTRIKDEDIHKPNTIIKDELRINLKGMAIGNGYCDPINQMNYGSYLYQIGLIDSMERDLFEKLQKKIRTAILAEQWEKAALLMDKLMDGEVYNYSYFKNFTGFNYYYNFLMTEDDQDLTIFGKYLEDDEIRKAMHVGGLPFNSATAVLLHLAFDILKSEASTISTLLSHYRMLFYNGQLDIVVAYPLTQSFLRQLNFSSADEYKVAARKIWKVNDEVAGYVKTAGNLTEILVRNAGHMVPHDQPQWALSMISSFIKGKF